MCKILDKPVANTGGGGCGGMRTEAQIKAKIEELEGLIKEWQLERDKECMKHPDFQDKGYRDYCTQNVSEFLDKKSALEWVLNTVEDIAE